MKIIEATKKVIVVTVALLLVGCSAAIIITPPEAFQPNNKFTTDYGYDKTWTNVVDWFAVHLITIDKLV